MDDINDYIIIIVYPDGTIEKIVKDSRIYHMEYLVSLINSSKRLKKLVSEKNIYVPTDEDEIRFSTTYDLDAKLANEGLVIFHNLLIDLDIVDEIDDWQKAFHITLPSTLSDKQKEILSSVLNNNDMSECWFGILNNNAIQDIDYEEVIEMINNKTK